MVDVHDCRRTRVPAFARPGRCGRSPFVRLASFWPTSQPGKPAISLAVGEPQHPVPPFVGPVLAAHLDDFGRYPMNKGIDAFLPGGGRLARPAL